MSIITISRGSYSRGKEIAEKLAEKLNYEIVSRDIILQASEKFNIPEIKLVRALHDAPSILERFTYGKERYVAYIRKALLENVKKDNIIYHGLAGHFFLQGVSHVLKVRIISNIDARVKEEMARENISREEARYILKKDDEERRKWSLHLYGIDTWDPNLYDIVLHIDTLRADDAVEILYNVAKRPCFQTTPESTQQMADLVLAARAQALIVPKYPSAHVSCVASVISVTITAPLSLEAKVSGKVEEILKDLDGLKDLKINISPTFTHDTLHEL